MTSLNKKIYVAGHAGLVGSAIVRALKARGHGEILTRSRKEVDLLEPKQVSAFFESERPSVVFLAAAKAGGIQANFAQPVEFLRENLLIQTNVFDAAHRAGVDKLVFLGSSCIYPKFAQQPIREDSLLTGPLESTNSAYAIAKIAGVIMAQSYRREYGMNAISIMPTNLYGPNDNFDLESSHVLPALLRKMVDAKEAGAKVVSAWGTGTPRREFLHVDDLASASLFLAEAYESADPINVGCGTDVTIRELTELIARIVGYDGDIAWDSSKPDGTPQKRLDVSRLSALGWRARIGLEEGIRTTVAWYQERRSSPLP